MRCRAKLWAPARARGTAARAAAPAPAACRRDQDAAAKRSPLLQKKRGRLLALALPGLSQCSAVAPHLAGKTLSCVAGGSGTPLRASRRSAPACVAREHRPVSRALGAGIMKTMPWASAWSSGRASCIASFIRHFDRPKKYAFWPNQRNLPLQCLNKVTK